MPVIPRIFGGPQTTPVVPSWFDDFSAANYAPSPADLKATYQFQSRYHCLFVPLDTYPGTATIQLAVPIFNSVFGTGATIPLAATSRLRLHSLNPDAAGGNIPNGQTWFLGLMMVPKIWGADLNGLAQFAEIQTIADTSSAGNFRMRYGISVLSSQGANPGGDPSFGASAYILICDNLINLALLYRGVSSSPTQVPGASVATCAFAVGDLVYMEVTPAAGQNTVVVKVNGVTQITFVDNNALRPRQIGLPGICYWSQVGNAEATLTNFRAGPL